MLDNSQISQIHELHLAGWPARRIARHLRVSRNTVASYLDSLDSQAPPVPLANQASPPLRAAANRPSKLDPFKSIIGEWLERDGKLSARLIFQQLRRTTGFDGGFTTVKDYLQTIRSASKPQRAFARLEPAPGERFDVDWAHFDSLAYQGDQKRKLYAYCMVDCHSRMLYVEFTHSQTLETFLRCHVNAFRFFSGVPREIWFDNLASAVAERDGNLIRFNPRLFAFAKRYRFLPRACHVAAGWEKGKVERAIGYLRQNFWPLRTFLDLHDVNRQVREWLDDTANIRAHSETRQTPRDRFRPDCLRSLPEIDADCRDVATPMVHKDLRLWFDGNRYCAPPSVVGRRITVKADSATVTLYDQERELACYPRCFSRGLTIGADRFHHALLARLPAVAKSAAQQRLIQLIGDDVEEFLRGIADTGNRALHRQIQELLALTRDYGPETVRPAVRRALDAKAFGADYVANIVRQTLAPRRAQPPLALKQRPLLDLIPDPLSLIAYDALLLPSANIENPSHPDEKVQS
ncbi:MAG: IS21 family transposase [Bryobacteraceae bacterium]